MIKAKITYTIEVEYEMHPEYYDAGITPQQMLEVDLQGAHDDPFLGMDRPEAKWTIKGELLRAAPSEGEKE